MIDRRRLAIVALLFLGAVSTLRAAGEITLRYGIPERPVTRRYAQRGIFQAAASRGGKAQRKIMTTSQGLAVRSEPVKEKPGRLDLVQRLGTGWVRTSAEGKKKTLKAGTKGTRRIDRQGRVVRGAMGELGLVFPEKAVAPGGRWRVRLPRASGRPFEELYRFRFEKLETIGGRRCARIAVTMKGSWSFRKPAEKGGAAETVILEKVYRATIHFAVDEGFLVRARVAKRSIMRFPDRGKGHSLRQDFRLARDLTG